MRFRAGRLPKAAADRLRAYVREKLGADPSALLCEEPRLACFEGVCAVYCGGAGGLPLPAIYSGAWVGVLVGGMVAPSPEVYERAFRAAGPRAAAVAADQGVRAFLYGNDLLLESVLELYEPLDDLVAVVDALDWRVVGVARWDRARRVFKNVYDLGMFLRSFG